MSDEIVARVVDDMMRRYRPAPIVVWWQDDVCDYEQTVMRHSVSAADFGGMVAEVMASVLGQTGRK